MNRSTPKLIVGIIAALAVSVLAAAALVSKSAAIVVVVLAFILLLVLLWVGYGLYGGRPQALTDEAAIAERLAGLRKGASTYLATWSGIYDQPYVERYFEAEAKDLEDNEHLTITRVVNPNALPVSHHRVLQAMRARFPKRFQLFEDPAIHSFELYYAAYPAGRSPMAAVVLIDANVQRPKVGLVLDPNRDPKLVGAVAAVHEWYIQMLRGLEMFDPGAITRWDHLAPRQTRFITENAQNLSFLSRVVAAEQQAVRSHLADLVAANRPIAVVDVGCGDGRAALRYVPPTLAPHVAYVLGLDYSPRMVSAAHDALKTAVAMAEAAVPDVRDLYGRTAFFHLDAFTIRSFFEDGRLRDVEQLVEASPAGSNPSLDTVTFAESQKVYCCLLNTLGTIDEDERRIELVEGLLSSLGVGDCLLVSVFSGAAFETEAQSYYEGLEHYLDAGNAKQTFDVQARVFEVAGVPGYREQWFEPLQVSDMFQAAIGSLAAVGNGRRFETTSTPLDSVGHLFLVRRRA